MEEINEVLKRASDLRVAKRFEEALRLLKSVLQQDENEWKVCTELGHLCIDKGEYKKATTMFERAVILKPDMAGLWSNLGYAKKTNGDLDGAIHDTRKAKSLAKDSFELHGAMYNLSCYLALSGKTESAMEYLAKACKGEPSLKEWARTDSDLASLRSDPRFDEILEYSPEST
ncbi:MAG: tetratricopeptide repeat protein [Candidatus Thorarchaeota archaeon]